MATGDLRMGWASVDITPAEPVQLAGQFHVRISEGVRDPVTATVLALSTASTDEAVVMVSCDLVAISDGLRDAVRARVGDTIQGLAPWQIVLNATHSHTAPEVRVPGDYVLLGGGISSEGICVDLPGIEPAVYVAFAAEQIADAVRRAWAGRAPGAIGYGLGHAVIGRNRRSCFLGGESRMYGDTAADDFSHIEGGEDHGVNLLGTWDAGGKLTGLVVNVACPSQVSENEYEISADYWHDVRVELRRRHGEDLFVLPQCSVAGDQSPHIQWGRAAEERMQALAGRTLRQELAIRIADAVSATLPLMAGDRQSDLELVHGVETVELSRRRLSEADVAEALAERDALQAEYAVIQQEIEAHPERKEEPRWHIQLTHCYRRMRWCEGVALRFEQEKTSATLPVEVHVLRLGGVALATNPFELYLDFGIRIKARSPAIQTFLVQLAGAGTYVPTERAVAGKSYGAIPASTPVGPEGGRELADATVRMLRAIWI